MMRDQKIADLVDNMISNSIEKLEEFFEKKTSSIAITGAGLSYPVYPLFSDLIKGMIEKCIPSKNENFNDYMYGSNNLFFLAEECKKNNETEFFKYLRDVFVPTRFSSPNTDLIARLPFKAYFNLNFEQLLEDSLNKHLLPGYGLDVYCSHDSFVPTFENIGLYYLHGKSLDNPSNLLIAENELKNAYERPNSPLYNFLFTYLKLDTLIIGSKMDEYWIKNIFKNIKKLGSNSSSKILLTGSEILRSNDFDQYRRILNEENEYDRIILREFGITTLRYPYSNRFHEELTSILENISNKFYRNPRILSEDPKVK